MPQAVSLLPSNEDEAGPVARKSASHVLSAQADLSREWLMISLSTFLVSLSACKRHQTNFLVCSCTRGSRKY